MSLLAGAARVEIPVPVPVQLAGYGRERVAVEVADTLHARALVVEHEQRRFGLVSLDLLWVERRLMPWIRARAEAVAGVAPGDLMVCATHTHSGPDTIDWFHFAPVDQAWLAALVGQIGAAVALAAARLQPARMTWQQGQVELGVNRRQHTADGVRIGVNPDGPVDHTMTVVRVDDDGGRPLASVVHQATHPVILGGDSLVVSGDWPGEMARGVEQFTGGVCLFINGAAGDINPQRQGRGYDEVQRVGAQAAGAALELLHRLPGDQPQARWQTASREVRVESRPHPYLEIPQHRRLAADGGLVFEVQGLAVGPLSLLSAPGECLVETGWAIERETALPNALIAGYTNDYVGYLPLPAVTAEGGYEAEATMLEPAGVLDFVAAAVAVGNRLAEEPAR